MLMRNIAVGLLICGLTVAAVLLETKWEEGLDQPRNPAPDKTVCDQPEHSKDWYCDDLKEMGK